MKLCWRQIIVCGCFMTWDIGQYQVDAQLCPAMSEIHESMHSQFKMTLKWVLTTLKCEVAID